MLKARKFTAHAQCHVTCKQGVKNDHTFGIPVAILSIHYTTFMGHLAYAIKEKIKT